MAVRGTPRPLASTARCKPSARTPNQSWELTQPKTHGLVWGFFAELYLFGAASQEPAPYLVIEGEDSVELLRGQLHPLSSGKEHRSMRKGTEMQQGTGMFGGFFIITFILPGTSEESFLARAKVCKTRRTGMSWKPPGKDTFF